MAFVHKNKKRKTVSDIMTRLSQSEKLAKETLDRVRTKINTAREPLSRNNNKHVACCPLTDTDESSLSIEDGDYITKVSLPQQKSYSGKTFVCRSDSSSDSSNGIKSPIRDKEFLSKPEKHIDPAVCVHKTWDLIGYHLNRISFHCECYLTTLPAEAMTEADKLHCQRFHHHCYGQTHRSRSRKSKNGKRGKEDQSEDL